MNLKLTEMKNDAVITAFLLGVHPEVDAGKVYFVLKVLDSCIDTFQADNVINMIDNLYCMLNHKQQKTAAPLFTHLRELVIDKKQVLYQSYAERNYI